MSLLFGPAAPRNDMLSNMASQHSCPDEDQARLGTLPRLAIIVVVLVVIAFLSGMAALVFGDSNDPEPPAGVHYLGPPKPLDDFSLAGAAGESMSLSDLRGSPVLLFFGYTHCPDVCPTTLAEFREIKRLLGEAGDQVRFVFISIDGSRDDPEIVERFVTRFDESFIGLTGPEDDVQQYASDYFLYFERADAGESAAGYLVDHTSYSYVIDEEGRLTAIYPFDTDMLTIVQDLRDLLES